MFQSPNNFIPLHWTLPAVPCLSRPGEPKTEQYSRCCLPRAEHAGKITFPNLKPNLALLSAPQQTFGLLGHKSAVLAHGTCCHLDLRYFGTAELLSSRPTPIITVLSSLIATPLPSLFFPPLTSHLTYRGFDHQAKFLI